MKSFSEIQEEQEFQEFCRYIDLVESNPTEAETLINEGFFDTAVDKIGMIKEFFSRLSLDYHDFIKLFKEKYLYKFFSGIKWSIDKLVKVVKEGFNIHRKLVNIIVDYAKENKIVQWTDEAVKKLDKFLEEHPYIRKISGLAVAGFLIYQWTQLISFTGDVDFDFDQTVLFQALAGNYTLAEIFSGEAGIKLLMFIALNALTGLSFPWPGDTWLLFMMSIVYTVAKYKLPSAAVKMRPLLQKAAFTKVKA